MSQKPNTTSIGLFIVTGVALGVAGVLLFSSSKMFTETRDIIVYFDDSLNGLNEGAPVKFRGVTIGSVKQVMVHFNQATNDYAMPVIIEFEERLLQQRMPDLAYTFREGALTERIHGGLRATLQTESLVTGVLYVGVDVDPKAPPPVYHQLEKVFPEVPSVPTKTQQLLNNLASLDIKSIETNVTDLLLQLRSLVGELKMAEINAGVTNLLASVNRLVTDPGLSNAVAGIRPTLDQYRELGARITSKMDPLSDRLTHSLAQADLALAELRGAGEDLRSMLAPDAPLSNDLDQALRQLSGAVQSLSVFLDFLKQHPNALITGRKHLRP